ncbi:hypothetical protein AAE02nite_07000 [Adhaeribacter aerolatus]|uniref:Uncharacterized protein n=1 Tax=Adhaeribacter aerolatus TaxID=670289 RepID=A0A512ATK3_9BACT|nr:hypothetical protein AAE02nite_07000 [Adhaeribacter aerolatus]
MAFKKLLSGFIVVYLKYTISLKGYSINNLVQASAQTFSAYLWQVLRTIWYEFYVSGYAPKNGSQQISLLTFPVNNW